MEPHGDITQKDLDFGRHLDAEWHQGIPPGLPLDQMESWIQKRFQQLQKDLAEAEERKKTLAKMAAPQKSDERPLNETLREWEARMKRTYFRPVTTREKMKFIKEHLSAEATTPKPSAFKRFLARLGRHRGERIVRPVTDNPD